MQAENALIVELCCQREQHFAQPVSITEKAENSVASRRI